VFERRRAKEAEAAYETQLAEWTQQRDESAHMLAVAQTYAGETASDKLLLKASEHLIGTVSGVGLIEERRGPGPVPPPSVPEPPLPYCPVHTGAPPGTRTPNPRIKSEPEHTSDGDA
jgi:hypothetical protein